MKKLNVNLKIKYDLSKPNGMKRKKLDLTIANKYGWKAKTKLDEAFKKVYLVQAPVANKDKFVNY